MQVITISASSLSASFNCVPLTQPIVFLWDRFIPAPDPYRYVDFSLSSQRTIKQFTNYARKGSANSNVTVEGSRRFSCQSRNSVISSSSTFMCPGGRPAPFPLRLGINLILSQHLFSLQIQPFHSYLGPLPVLLQEMRSCHRIDLCDEESCHEHALRIGQTGYHFDWRGWVYRIGSFSFLLVLLFYSGWILNLEDPSRLGNVATAHRMDFARYVTTQEMTTRSELTSGSYLETFSGHEECGLSLPNLYVGPQRSEGYLPKMSFCPDRQTLLGALSGGGPHGFNAPYTPTGIVPLCSSRDSNLW